MISVKGDIILVAGKGHETYQEIRGVKHHFDDREIINEFLNPTTNS
jgi:UDP-N-acetylmuramoyl-L-alanyl-D-glutamate--2,6-diaminopimelate ligase